MLCFQKLLSMVNIIFWFWKFCDYISRKHRELVGNGILHHDNACPHVATSFQQCLSECINNIMPHLLYSPDFSPYDLRLFSMLKLHGKKFCTNSEVIPTVQGSVKQFPEKSFSTCFKKCVEWLDYCISSGGSTLKKNGLFFAVNLFLDYLPFFSWFLWNTLYM